MKDNKYEMALLLKLNEILNNHHLYNMFNTFISTIFNTLFYVSILII